MYSSQTEGIETKEEIENRVLESDFIYFQYFYVHNNAGTIAREKME